MPAAATRHNSNPFPRQVFHSNNRLDQVRLYHRGNMEVSWNIEPPLKAPPLSLSEAPLLGRRSPSSPPFKQPPPHVPVPSLSRPPPMDVPSTIVPQLKAPPMRRRSPPSPPFKQPPPHVPVPSLSPPPPMEVPWTIAPQLKAPPMHKRSRHHMTINITSHHP